MKTTGKNVCAMSEDCEGKEADHGLMCADHRAEDDRLKEVIGGGHPRSPKASRRKGR